MSHDKISDNTSDKAAIANKGHDPESHENVQNHGFNDHDLKSEDVKSDKCQDFKQDFPLLIEAGFIAVKQLDETSANRIFQAAQALSPESTAPQIGIGYIALNKLEVKEAARIFEEIIKKEPENHLAVTFLGICYLLTKPKKKKGEELIKEAIRKTNNPTIKSLGEVSLEWAERDLKMKSAPFFSAKSAEDEEANDRK